LAPKHYIHYCHKTFGERIILEAHPPFEMAQPSSPQSWYGTHSSTSTSTESESSTTSETYYQRTIDLWTAMYPHETFFLRVNDKGMSHNCHEAKMESSPSVLLYGFDLLGSIERQANFLWQVSGERFGDDDFLLEGVQNYYHFLQLKPTATQHGTILVPTYQIDLMWHTHILSSIQMYDKDCIRIMNSTMHHDDSLTDRAEGGILDVSFAATKSLWMKHFGTDYIVAGGMYRGEPPMEYHTSKWRTYEDSLPSQITNVALIGKVGASSIGSTTAVPARWAPLDGTVSNGSPAFIDVQHQTKSENLGLPHRTDYVLGRYGNDTGYYHVETRPANEILLKRVERQLSTIESKIAFQKCCCGSVRSIQALERKRRELLQCQTLLRERLAAEAPVGSTHTKTIGTSTVNGDGGVWIYPPVLYDSAGGACGGVVCSSGTSYTLFLN
jgi:hypothetical protein